MALKTRDWILIGVSIGLVVFFIVFVGLWFGWPKFRTLFSLKKGTSKGMVESSETSSSQSSNPSAAPLPEIPLTRGDMYATDEELKKAQRVLPSGELPGTRPYLPSDMMTSRLDHSLNNAMGIY